MTMTDISVGDTQPNPGSPEAKPAAGSAAPAAPPAAKAPMDDLIEERKRLEKYTEEQYARLNRLRELLRSEKAELETELQKRRAQLEREGPWAEEIKQLRDQLHELQQGFQQSEEERDNLKAQVQTLQGGQKLQQELDKVRRERDAARAQVQQLNQKHEEFKREADHTAAQLRQQLEYVEEELAQQEQEVAAERQRMNEQMKQLEQQVTEIQERERGQKETAPKRNATVNMPIQRVVFGCRCGQKLRAIEKMVGMSVKCPKCGQESTVPKSSDPNLV